MTEDCLECPTGRIPGPTGVCDQCGARYVRGQLVNEGRVRKAVPIKDRLAAKPVPEKKRPFNFDRLSWTSLQPGKTKDDAIENLWACYRKKPGLRRLDPSEAYEVTYAEPVAKDEKGRPLGYGWWLTVRKVRNHAVLLQGDDPAIPSAGEPGPIPGMDAGATGS